MRPVDAVVCWRWAPPAGYRSTFGPETVNALFRSVRRHYPHPHRFICVTDQSHGIDPGVEVQPDFGDFARVPNPFGTKNPSCYRRLRLFHPEAARWFGQRFVSIDLDAVITGDLSALWNRSEEVVMWGDTNPTTFYNGSIMLLTAGARPKVWTDFDPLVSPAEARRAGQFGSDQGWISHALGPREAKWTQTDGVYSYRVHLAPRGGQLPPNARIVLFHGQVDPWDTRGQRIPWVKQHWGSGQV